VDNHSRSKQITEKEKEQNLRVKRKKNNTINKKSSQNDIKLLIKGLSDENGLIRRSYSEALARLGKAALPDLIKILINFFRKKNLISNKINE